MEPRQSEKRFALLIDADNVSAKYIKPILAELSKYGTVTYKRIYGDWTSTLHAKWKDALLENSITPIQQFSYTVGKNATDSAMIIDAMDILYAGSVEGFCIVSSDSDFTRLASRIRESGLTVVGMGEKKTPTPFRKACDIFTTLELLVSNGKRRGHVAGADDGANGPATSIEDIEQAVVDIITDNQNNGKATGLGEVGSRLLKRYPDFDVRSYGTNLLSKLLDDFASVRIAKEGSNVAVVLADAPKAEGRKSGEAGKAEGGKGGAAKAEAAKNGTGKPEGAGLDEAKSDAPSAGASESSAGAADEKPSKSRRRRKSRKVEAHAEGSTDVQPTKDASDEGRGDSAAAPVEGRDGSDDAGQADSAAAKPRRRRKKAAQVADAPAAVEVSEGLASADAPASADTSASADAPEAFVVESVRAAGAAGVDVAELGKQVRAKFRAFKVREAGYASTRAWVAGIPGLKVEKRDGAYFAVTA